MDLGFFGHIVLEWDFFSGLVRIILIDLVLAGDNAVLIAMAVRSLPKAQRMKGIIFGAGGGGPAAGRDDCFCVSTHGDFVRQAHRRSPRPLDRGQAVCGRGSRRRTLQRGE